MAKAKKEFTISEQISALENRVAEKVSSQSKILDHDGKMLGSVTLRLRNLKDGKMRFYLDINRKNQKRKCYFLDCFLDPTLVVRTSKVVKGKRIEVTEIGQANETAISNAETKRAEYFSAIRDGRDVIAKSEAKNDVLLLDWLKSYQKQKADTGQSDGRALSVGKLISHVELYDNKKPKLSDIDEDWCKGFILYLSKAKSGRSTKNEKTISRSTATLYYSILIAALNEAVRKKLITSNPTKNLSREDRKPIKADKSNRPYLTIDEVKSLMATDCKYPEIKRAFLFGCFTGLRISDIRKLSWDNISKRKEGSFLKITMQKTREALAMKLNKQAVALLADKGKGLVFNLPIWDSVINDALKAWANKAGIEKDISFHVSRHTFATMELTLGADLYVVSKLLGHTDVGTTQIYAEIIDKRRDEAVELVDNAF